MMEDNDWLKGLKNKLDDYEEPVPEGLWEDIESSVFPRKKRHLIPMPVLWRSTAVAAAVALGVFAGLRLYDSGTDRPSPDPQGILASSRSNSSSADSEGSRDSSVEIVGREEPGSLVAEARPAVERPATAARKAVTRVDVIEPSPESGFAATEVVGQLPVEPETTSGTDGVQTVIEEDKKTKVPVVTTSHDGEDWSDYISATDDSRASRRRAASLDVSFSEGSMSSNDERSFDLLMFYRGSAPASSSGLIGDFGNIGNDSQIRTRSLAPMEVKGVSTVTSKADHRRPVRLALTVNCPVAGWLGIETGLTMTTLRSTFSSEAGNTLTETEQTLRYLGVPVNMTASLLDSKWFSLYVGAGGMAEKCVSGKSVTTETLAGVRQSDSKSKDLDVKPLLWSLNTSAGLQANLTKRLGIYAEPGLSYHFDDKSGVQTIYKDRPLDFMLTFGARITLR